MSYRALGIEPVRTYPITTDTRSWAERNQTGLLIGAGIVGLIGIIALSWMVESKIESSIRKESGESGVHTYRMARLGTSLMTMPLWWY